MIKKDGTRGFKLLNFDWAGKKGVARYPMNPNRGPGLWRPEAVQDGELILDHHDLLMLEYMRCEFSGILTPATR